MVRENQIVAMDIDEHYACTPCGREFGSEKSLLQHCRNYLDHRSTWCNRCERLFVDSDARQRHLNDSWRHWICHLCGRDEIDEEELVRHKERDHRYCRDCEVYFFGNRHQHRVECHHRCDECKEEFETENNLIMHQKTHLPLDLSCYSCSRRFATESAILIHLESGTCSSGVDIGDIDRWAKECYQSEYYVNEYSSDPDYYCAECGADFNFISALLQHVESPVRQIMKGLCWSSRITWRRKSVNVNVDEYMQSSSDDS